MYLASRSLMLAILVFLAAHSAADTIQMYTRGDKSLAARLQAIRGAKRSVGIITYEFKPCDSSTKALIAVLTKKAKEGLNVRVMIDDYPIDPAQKKGLASYFKSMGIKFKTYNQGILLGRNHRNHIKLTLIDPDGDSPSYFADSSNYSDQYFGMSGTRNYVNRDFKISGASTAQAAAAFEMLWASRPADPVGVNMAGVQKFYDSCLKQKSRDLDVASYFSANMAALAEAGGYSCSKIKYVADDPRFQDAGLSPTNDRENRNEEYMNDLRLKRKLATASFLDFVDRARTVLNIENQYFIPVYRMRTLFNELSKDRDISTLVLTNLTSEGIDETSSRQLSFYITKSARKFSKGEMAVVTLPSLGRLAVRNPLTPVNGRVVPWHLHSKSMVRDHRDVWMGSYNIDPRSYHTNLEYAVTVRDCAPLANAIERDYKSMLVAYKSDMKDCKACRTETSDLNPFEAIGAFFKQNFL